MFGALNDERAFAALTVRDFAAAATAPVAAALYVLGSLSCYVSRAVVALYYTGQIYGYVNSPPACASFVVFSLLPGAARALYGWSFDLF